MQMIPTTGQVVHVRQRTWLVTDAPQPRGPRDGAVHRVTLSCLDEDAAGDTAEVLWEIEPGARILDQGGRLDPRGTLDDPRMFAAYLAAVRWHCVTSTDRRLLQSPFRAGIDLKPYQLEPLRKALELPRVNLFIADDVGLGKTIEAGLILQEMLLRQRVERVLVICPPAVALQWQEELDQRFGLPFAIYDRDFVDARRRERGWGVNPWTTRHHFIVSTTLLRGQRTTKRKGVPRTDHLALLLSALQDEGGGSSRVPRSLLIFDEAHHAAPASRGRWGIDSRTTRAVRDLAQRFEHRLFLSATPHNGLSNSFSALLELLDPQRFARATPIESVRELEPVMVRRLKKHLRHEVAGLPERVLVDHVIRLDRDSPELRLNHLLADYDSAYRETLADLPDKQRAARGLVLVRLHKHLLSSVAAFAETLRKHADKVEARLADTEHAISAQAALALAETHDPDGADASERGADDPADDAARDEAVDALTLAPSARALSILREMQALADAHADQPDDRMRHFADWLNATLLTADGDWRPRRVVLFTEYDSTLRFIRAQLPGLLNTADIDRRIDHYTGQRGDTQRQQIKEAFNTDPQRHPLRILLCTDAAREGINLQAHCNHLWHYDLPWNPGRVEQRNGRIDRTLQPMPRAFCHYFDLPDRPQDKVLTYMVQRLATIGDELGSLSDVLSTRVAERMQQGIRDLDTRAIDRLSTPGDAAMAAARLLEGRYADDAGRLQGDLETLERQLDRSRRQVDYDADQLRHVVDLGLRLVCGAGLTLSDPPTDPPSYRLPVDPLGPTWSSTLDPLREPPAPDAKPWQRPPVRPVAFRAAHRLDADTVQLHLGHPLVKRLLARFRSQGFAAHDLARATLIHAPEESSRRVILLGRLGLYGQGATRLHEQVIAVSARWSADAAPTPYRKDAHARAMTLLDARLAAGAPAHPDAAVQRAARAHLRRDIDALWPALEAEAADAERAARDKLAERGDREAGDMDALLDRQRERAHRALAELAPATDQLALDVYTREERDQRARDLRALSTRLEALAAELEDEPDAIRRSYAVTLRRFEAVGLIHLWP